MSGDNPAVPLPPLLRTLREATHHWHQSLDSAFGSLDLMDKGGLTRFLAGHAIGLARLAAPFRRFVEEELHLPSPDYETLLRDDLRALGGKPVARLATPAEPLPSAPGSGLGLAYVVAGSRLGMAVLRKRGYHGRDHGQALSYMEDSQGPDIWRAVLAYMGARDFDPVKAGTARAAAIAGFASFAHGFASVSEPEQPTALPDARVSGERRA